MKPGFDSQQPESYTRNMFEDFRRLNLRLGTYVLAGSSVLEVHGIRKARDVDFVCLPLQFRELKKRSWKKKRFFLGWPFRSCLQHGKLEAYSSFKLYWKYRPETEDLIRRADIVDGIAYTSLEDMRIVKLSLGREKDLNDVTLIDEHFKIATCPICRQRAIERKQ